MNTRITELETRIAELQRENDALRRMCHDHDRRRDASMTLARTLAERPDLGMSDDWPAYGAGIDGANLGISTVD